MCTSPPVRSPWGYENDTRLRIQWRILFWCLAWHTVLLHRRRYVHWKETRRPLVEWSLADGVIARSYRAIRSRALFCHLGLCLIILATEIDARTARRCRSSNGHKNRDCFRSSLDKVVFTSNRSNLPIYDKLVCASLPEVDRSTAKHD